MQKEVIIIDVSVKGQQGLDKITATILEQKEITIEFKKELALLEQQLAKTPKNQFSAQKVLKDQITGLKVAIKDQSLALQDLNLEKQKATSIDKKVTVSGNNLGKSIVKNRGFLSALNTITGGVSNQIYGFGKSLMASITAVKGLSFSLKGLRGAIIATGIGALVVALGAIVAYWDDIKTAISGVSKETAKALTTQTLVTTEAKKQYELSQGQDNILKEQGKSELQILDYKKEQTAEIIKQIQAEILLTKRAADEKVKSAAKVDAALSMLPFGRSLAGIFGGDAATIAKEGNEASSELQKQLNDLLNTQAGYSQDSANIRKDEIIKRLQENEKLTAEAQQLDVEWWKEFGFTSADAYAAAFEEKIKEKDTLFSDFNKLDGLINADFDAEFALDMSRNKERADSFEAAEELIRKSKLTTLDTIRGAAGEESALGKAAFLAKQIMVLQQIRLDFLDLKSRATKTVAVASLNAAESGTEVAKGAAKAGATLNPFVIAGYAVSAVAVIASMVSAVKKAKAVSSQFGGGFSSSVSAPSLPAATAPSFNIVGQSGTNQLAESIGSQEKKPLKAYVVSGDVTTAQAMERNIIASASI